MPPASASAPCEAGSARPSPSELLGGYQAALAARGAGNKSFLSAARSFLARWPGPQDETGIGRIVSLPDWARQSIDRRLEREAAA